MQCNAMQCNAMQCNAMQCNAMQCNAKSEARQPLLRVSIASGGEVGKSPAEQVESATFVDHRDIEIASPLLCGALLSVQGGRLANAHSSINAHTSPNSRRRLSHLQLTASSSYNTFSDHYVLIVDCYSAVMTPTSLFMPP